MRLANRYESFSHIHTECCPTSPIYLLVPLRGEIPVNGIRVIKRCAVVKLSVDG